MSVNPCAIAHYPVLEAVLDTIVDLVNRAKAAIGRSDDLSQCDPQEVARVAHDLGISAAEFRSLATADPDSADVLQRMLSALGIDPKALAEADPLVMRDLQRLCVTCRNKTRCRRELDEFTASTCFDEYCPNAVTLKALLSERSA